MWKSIYSIFNLLVIVFFIGLTGCLPVEPGVTIEEDVGLRHHSIFRPTDLAALPEKLPIVVWGEGGCFAPSLSFGEFLTRIASENYLVIANNGLYELHLTNSQMLLDAIDWAIAENSRPGSKYFDRIDIEKIAVMGQSCGGLEALHIADDPRVTTVVAWNSGIFDFGNLGGATMQDLEEIAVPAMWVNGGPLDIAYPQGKKNFELAPDHLPAVWANYDMSEKGGSLFGAHLGTFLEPLGGAFGEAAVLWLDFTLKDIQINRSYFIGPDCGLCSTDPKWSVLSRNWD